MSASLDTFPFYDTDDFEFNRLFNDEPVMPHCNFQNDLFSMSKNDYFKSLECSYFSCDEFNDKFDKNKKNIELGLFHVNIRSLNSKVRELCSFLQLLHISFDVIVLSEVWSYNIDFYCNILDGYDLYTDIPTKSSIGGVGVFVKKGLHCNVRDDLKLSSSTVLNIENLWLEIVKNNKTYIIGAIYRHPNNYINDFSSHLESNLLKLSKKKISCFIVGDINIDLIKYDSSRDISAYLSNLLLHNFLPSILLPTRITLKSATLIDHIYYYEGNNRKKEVEIFSGNIFSDLSDHLPNFVILRNVKSKPDLHNRPFVRLYSKENNKHFQNCLKAIDWNLVLFNIDEVDTSFDKFCSLVNNAFESSYPLTRVSRRALKDKKWMSSGLKKSCKTKNKLYKRWLVTKNVEDHLYYINYKRIYNRLIRNAQVSYYKLQFDSKVNNIKQLWINLNKICSTKKSSQGNVIKKVLVDGVEIHSPVDICNAFNEYFCNVGVNLVKNLPPASKSFTDYLKSSLSESIYVEPITELEIFNLINSLSNKKSCGHDGINTILIKDNVKHFCKPLTYLFNLSLSSGSFPSNFKVAKVIPLFKKGDHLLTSNYRPISLLCTFSKILEKLVYKRMFNFFNKHNILYKHQFGFRKNYSPSMALLEVIDECYKNIDINNKVVGIYFDVQKAFDSVDHSILLTKLYNYGIRGVLHSWITSYLHNRQQYTIINNISSKIDNIACGVPQGSVLGPLLFLVYINDIQNAISGGQPKLFADDTNLFLFDPDVKTLENKANFCLKQMEDWFSANRLTLNAEKTCYTIFGFKGKKDINLNLFINNRKIIKVASCKYLGVTIDESLKWDVHVNNICSKLIKFTGILYKIRNILPKACLFKLYYAFLHPHLLYGVEVYANASKSTLDKLSKLNNRLLRIILNKNIETPVMNMYRELNTLPVYLLHEMYLLVFIFKCQYHEYLVPSLFLNYFKKSSNIHSYNTRHNSDFHLFSVNASIGQRCTIFRGSKMWNNLPTSLKKYASVNEFKNKIKLYLFDRC